MEYWVENKIPFDYVIDSKTLDWFEPYDKKYSYNSQILEALTESLASCGFTLTDDQKDNVNRFIYVARGSLRERRLKEREKRMLDNSWLILNAEIVKKAFQENKKMLINAEMQGAIFTSKVDGKFKPFVDAEGNCYLMKPKAKTRGFHISRFDNAFCKIV